ncbi:zinc finger, CCHC-type containing protein [Tanacetum coccineum]
MKRQRTNKENDTSKKTSATKYSSKGKSPTTSSKSSKSSKFAKDQVEEPMQDFDYADMPRDQGEVLGKTVEQPNDEAVHKNDWYKKSSSDTSLDPEWNEGKSVDDEPEKSWLNDMAKVTKPPLTFDELMHTPIDFSAFVMNRLKIDNLTKEILVGLAYNLAKWIVQKFCGDYSKPSHEGYRNTTELPVENNVVPLLSDTIRLVQNGCSFYGLRSKDPNQHLNDFLKLVDLFDLDGENRERTRLRLFQFFLHDQASNWLERLPTGSITIWEDLTTRFLAQFFLPGRTAKLRNDILMFQQHHGESLSEAWTRFKDLLQKVPHHGIKLWLQV